MIGILKSLLGDKKDKDRKELEPIAQMVNAEYEKLTGLSNDELRAFTADLRKTIKERTADLENEIKSLTEKGEGDNISAEDREALFDQVDEKTNALDDKIEEVLEEIMPKAFAAVKETARRFKENDYLEVTASVMDIELAAGRESIEIVGDKARWHRKWLAAGSEIEWDMVHYDVQLMGGYVLHSGKIAEMQTGEGKTLVATLPVFLNALTGKGVHLVTVNDYLAKRDSEWMGPLYEFHGLRVDCIDKHQPNSPERKEAYRADITFGTNNEFGFDYLRDNMTTDVENIVQKKHHYAIVDEVDSVLIDDARTPLIISGPTPKSNNDEFQFMKPKIEKLVNAQRKVINGFITDAKRLLKGDEEGDKKTDKEGGLALLRAYRGLPKNKALIKFLSEPGIRAKLQKTENYYLQDQEKEMPFVDKELYFTIDEKSNSIELSEKGIDLLSDGEDASPYILPDLGDEIARIESEASSDEQKLELKDELMRDYTLKAERIHVMNQLLKAYTLFEKENEYVIMDGKVKIVDEQTGRIMDGRRYSEGLHQAIEAKENVKVQDSTQTYATITLQNFFRMYHKLAGMTGTAETEAKEFWEIYELDVVVIPTNRPVVRKDDNDLVYRTVREKFNAVIEEVEKLVEAGRPVLVGTTTVESSELLSRMLKLRKIKHQVLNAKYHQKEAEIVAEAGLPGAVTIATNMAGRGTDIKLGPGVKEAGGLAIIGTERHESRRIDRQLRGRAGRQGDPGSSQFFVSLEDNLMRLFGSERIAKVMDRLGMKEGEVIQHGMITKSIERAQRKVEENNFGIRKRLLEYDDVLNMQRNAIYKRRKNALYGERLEMDIENIFTEVAHGLVEDFKESGDFESFRMEVLRVFAIDSPVKTSNEFIEIDPMELAESLKADAWAGYQRHIDGIREQVMPVIRNIKEREGDDHKKLIRFLFRDGRRGLYILADIQDAFDSDGHTLRKAIQRSVSLATIDDEWKEHLREMDDLRDSVRHAQYEQKDPLVIYKLEGHELFRQLMERVNKDIISFLCKSGLPAQTQSEAANIPVEAEVVGKSTPKKEPKLQTSHTQLPQYGAPSGSGSGSGQEQPQQPEQEKAQPVVREKKKVGRNEMVTIYNVVTNEKKQTKFKLAEPMIRSGQWRLVEDEA